MIMLVDAVPGQHPLRPHLPTRWSTRGKEHGAVHPHPAGGYLQRHAHRFEGALPCSINTDILSHHRHDRPPASGHPHHHHGHLPAGLRRPGPQAACAQRSTTRSARCAENLVRHRRGHRAGVRHPHRQQAHLRHAHRPGGRRLRHRGLCPLRPGAWTDAAKAVRRQLHRRLLRPGAEGHDRRRPAADRVHPRGAGRAPSSSAPRVNVGSTKAGINMDAVAADGPRSSRRPPSCTADQGGFGCAKLVVFCNAVEDNPFMAGAFHGVGEPETASSTWASPAPAWCTTPSRPSRAQPFDVVAETIKKTAFRITRMGQLVAQEASRRLDVPFGIVDLSLAPTPAMGDSRGPHSGGDGPGGLRHPRHHRRAGPAQRRGQEGRRHGLLPRGRPVRRLHPRQRGRGHDRRRRAPAR